MSFPADTPHCFLATELPAASPLLIHGVYQVEEEASPDLIRSQRLWQDKVEEAPSGWGQANGSGYQIMACHCINPGLV